MTSLIGVSVPRKEDQRLLTGLGSFVDDLVLPNQAYAVMVRSPHAHARIGAVDAAQAATLPDVLAVLTGRDWAADGLGGIPHQPNGVDHLDLTKPAFSPAPFRTARCRRTCRWLSICVRHVGEVVALVVAETEAAARDAAERVAIEYTPLPAVADAVSALAPDAPRLFAGRPDNICVAAANGDRAATAAALAGAHRVVRLSSRNHRVCGTPMEPRAALAHYDAADDTYTLHTPSQGVHRHKNALVAMFGAPPERVRVITRDVGGGFGIRSPCYPEYPLVMWASRRLGRPVKWTSTRAESFLSDFQARDFHVEGALALDRDGRFLGLELDYIGNLGAYPVSFAVLSNLMRMAGGVYDIPAQYVGVRGVVTNTLPVGVYRGAGRPESNFILERLVDMAAAELGLDRAELRRRNLIAAQALPYQSPLGHRYDTGAFAENMEKALRLVDWDGFPARRAAVAATRPARRHRRCQLPGVAHRLARRAHRHERAGRGPRHRRDRHPGKRPGPRDELRPGRGDAIADPDRRGVDPLRRQRHRANGRRLAFRPLAAARRHGPGARRRCDHRAWTQPRRARAGGRARGHRLCGRSLHGRRHRPRDRPLRGRRAGARSRHAGGAAGQAGGNLGSVAAPPRAPDRHRRLRGRDRSRNRARCGWCAMSRSTMSGASSIR